MIPIYETDDEGEIIYEDGIPVKSGDSFVGYQEPVEFYGNLSFYDGNSQTHYKFVFDGKGNIIKYSKRNGSNGLLSSWRKQRISNRNR